MVKGFMKTSLQIVPPALILSRNLLVLLTILMIASCGTTMTSIKEDVVTNIKDNEGYFLFGIKSDKDLREIIISGPKTIKISAKDLKKGKGRVYLDIEDSQVKSIATWIGRETYFHSSPWYVLYLPNP